jgi:Flp pilus assembly protein TadG
MKMVAHKQGYRMRTLARLHGMKPGDMRGAIVVEFAVLLIPLLLLAFGVAEYGRTLYQYNALVKAVRDSARFLSQHTPADAALYSLALDDARCLAVHGNTLCAGPPLAPQLTADMVGITSTTTTTLAGTQIALVEVRITGYTFDFVFNPARLMGSAPDTIPFGEIRATMRQQ